MQARTRDAEPAEQASGAASATTSADPSAGLEDFLKAHEPKLRHYVRGVAPDRATAEDALQDAMLAAYRAWGRISTYDRPDLWILRVAGRYARRDLLKQERMVPVGLDFGCYATAEDTSAAALDRAWFAEMSEKLPQRLREVYVLCDVLRYTANEAAEVLGVRPSTVRGHLSRTHALLRAQVAASDSELRDEQ